MRRCCQEYANALLAMEVLKVNVPEVLVPWVDELIAWTKAKLETHVDEAGEAAWYGD